MFYKICIMLSQLKNGLFEDVSNKITMNSAWTAVYKYGYRIGNIVFFQIEATTSSFIADYEYTLAELGQGIRSYQTVGGTCHITDANYTIRTMAHYLVKNGIPSTITVRANDTVGQYWFVSGFYRIA